MFSSNNLPVASSIFSAYASVAASMMLVRSVANELIPNPIRNYLYTVIGYLLKPKSSHLTLVIDENAGIGINQIYNAAEIYLRTKISPNIERLRICKAPKDKELTIKLEKDEKLVDVYEGVQLKWKFICAQIEANERNFSHKMEKRTFELTFLKKHKDQVLASYIPHILDTAKAIQNQQRVLRMYTLNNTPSGYGGGVRWDSINLEHPATFETLAMEPDLKDAILEDLNMFVKRKEFYKKVGRAWKRGYLLYGPPGTGKSSLVAAMANYLKFDVYDLQLGHVVSDSDLRRLLLGTGNKSILVIEDIDCSVDLPDRCNVPDHGAKKSDLQLTLSGLLNFIDGLWSSCGDERIIVFTTNHKERLDPALLRPGRMDMHINMSYCKSNGLRMLASNYLGINGHHMLLEEIGGLMDHVDITPAQVAEELMRSEDADVALQGLANLLKRKKLQGDQIVKEYADKDCIVQSKKQKIEINGTTHQSFSVRTSPRKSCRRRSFP